MLNIAIIGAGVSGLALANLLDGKANVQLFEKARGVGGRLSTRRAEPYVFDHGAQYFTARTPEFNSFIEPAIAADAVQRWNARWAQIDGNQIVNTVNWANDEPRYVGVPHMNSFAKYLAQNVIVHLNTQIVNLTHNQHWQLHAEQGDVFDEFDWVIITAPPQQAQALLPSGFQHINAVASADMTPCFALMLGFEVSVDIPFDAAHITNNSHLSWLAVNHSKPGRGEACSIIAHSSEAYATANINTYQDTVMEHLCDAASNILNHNMNRAQHKAVHRWLYANNATAQQQQGLIDPHLQLGVCGDWCEGGRVEGAFTSAQLLFEQLREYI